MPFPDFLIWLCAGCGAPAEGKKKPCGCATNVGTRIGPTGEQEQTWWNDLGADCQCPKCGRLHKDLNFGKPPQTISKQADLMRFYGVSTIDELIAAQDCHIARLQAKLPKPTEPLPPQNYRQG